MYWLMLVKKRTNKSRYTGLAPLEMHACILHVEGMCTHMLRVLWVQDVSRYDGIFVHNE